MDKWVCLPRMMIWNPCATATSRNKRKFKYFYISYSRFTITRVNPLRHGHAYMRKIKRSSLAQVMAWCRTGLLATGSPGTSFSNIWMKNKNVLFTKMHLEILSLKWRTFSSSLNMLRGRFLSINYDHTKADERKKMFANGLWSHILNHIKRLLSFIHQWCGKNLWNVSRYVPNVALIPLMCRCLEDKDGLRQVFEFMLNCLLVPTKQCRKTMKLQKDIQFAKNYYHCLLYPNVYVAFLF